MDRYRQDLGCGTTRWLECGCDDSEIVYGYHGNRPWTTVWRRHHETVQRDARRYFYLRALAEVVGRVSIVHYFKIEQMAMLLVPIHSPVHSVNTKYVVVVITWTLLVFPRRIRFFLYILFCPYILSVALPVISDQIEFWLCSTLQIRSSC